MSIVSRFLKNGRDRFQRHWYGRNIPKAHGLRRQLAYQVARQGFEIGDYSYATGTPIVRQWGEGSRLIVGKYCSVAAEVEFILGGLHPMDAVTTFPIGALFDVRIPPATRGDIVIGSDVWIATGATILSGVTIGHGAVIGARAVVTKDVAPYEIVAGNPARKIRARFDEETVRKLLDLRWWDLPTEALRPLVPLITGNRVDDFIRECSKLRPQVNVKAGQPVEFSNSPLTAATWTKP